MANLAWENVEGTVSVVVFVSFGLGYVCSISNGKIFAKVEVFDRLISACLHCISPLTLYCLYCVLCVDSNVLLARELCTFCFGSVLVHLLKSNLQTKPTHQSNVHFRHSNGYHWRLLVVAVIVLILEADYSMKTSVIWIGCFVSSIIAVNNMERTGRRRDDVRKSICNCGFGGSEFGFSKYEQKVMYDIWALLLSRLVSNMTSIYGNISSRSENILDDKYSVAQNAVCCVPCILESNVCRNMLQLLRSRLQLI